MKWHLYGLVVCEDFAFPPKVRESQFSRGRSEPPGDNLRVTEGFMEMIDIIVDGPAEQVVSTPRILALLYKGCA